MGTIVVYNLGEGYLSTLSRGGDTEGIGYTPLREASLYSFCHAKVLKKDETLGGFFVDTPWGEAFAPFSEVSPSRKVGDTFAAQVIRESVENKPPRVGEFFTLPLAGCEITINRRGVLFANPCGEKDKDKLLRVAKEKTLRLKVFDCKKCLRSLEILEDLLKAIFENLPFKWFHFFTQLLEGGGKLLTEDWSITNRLEFFKKIFRVEFFFKTAPVGELVKISPPSEIERLTLSERVGFDGGYLLVGENRGLIFVDVNGNPNASVLNRRAAEALFRLIKLRRWGGLIAVDFVSFKNPAERKPFKNWLKGGLLKTPCKGLGFTNGGLYEILCPRRTPSLSEVLTQYSPYCGRIKRDEFLLLEVLEKMANPRGETPKVRLHPIRKGLEKRIGERLGYKPIVEFDCDIPPDRFEVLF